MKVIPTQQDNVTELSADDFNEIPLEETNLISSADITPSSGDLSQIAKSTAVYAGGGDFYTDVGAVNAYVLQAIGNRKYPPAHFNGLRARFKSSNTNTSANVTVKLGSLNALSVSDNQVPNGGTPTIGVGDIEADKVYTLFYDKTPDGLTEYWRIDQAFISDLSITNAKINDVDTSKLNDGSIIMSSSELFQISAGGSEGATRMDSSGYSIVATDAATTYQLGTNIQSYGLSMPVGTGYGGGPGSVDYKARTSLFSFVPSSVSTASRIIDFSFSTPLQLTGIPIATNVHSVVLRFSTDIDGNDRYNLPLSVSYYPEDGGTYSVVTITGASALSTTALSGLSAIYNGYIEVVYDPTLVD